MLTTETINELFERSAKPDGRWLYTPTWNSPVNSHRYALTFLPPERRFVLSRMEIKPFVSVDDPELVEQFRATLSDIEVANCMRLAIQNKADPDDIPF